MEKLPTSKNRLARKILVYMGVGTLASVAMAGLIYALYIGFQVGASLLQQI